MRENRHYFKQRDIHFAGKPLGRPKEVTEANREELKRLQAERREEYVQPIPIEGKFGQGKNGYRLNHIRAKRADTSTASINSIFLVMNLLIVLRIFFALCKKEVATALFWTRQFEWVRGYFSLAGIAGRQTRFVLTGQTLTL